MNKSFFILILGLSIIHGLSAQHNIKFDKITVENGLSQSNINWIMQDDQGFIWFATNGGLNRFDGSQFKTYTHNDADSNSISNNIINHIYEDEIGKVWISTENGLSVFDKSLEVFTHYKSEPNNPYGLSSNQTTCTIKDDFGNYWIGTSGGGLNKYNPKTKKFRTYRNIIKNPESISSNYITCLEKDKYGYIWVGTNENGMNMLEPESGKFLRYVRSNINNASPSISSNQVNTIYEDNDGDLWVGTSVGIDLIKPKTNFRNLNTRDNIINFQQIISPGNATTGSSILSIYQGASGLLWFGTIDKGLGFLNKYTKSVGYYTIDPNNDFSVLSNNVTTVFDDRSGILWLGTNAGINIIDRQKDRFTWEKRSSGTSNALSSNNIQAIYKENNGVLWLGTYDKGLTKYDPETEIYTNYLFEDFIVEGESIKERNRVLKKYDKRKTKKKQSRIHYLSHNRIYALHRDMKKKL
ncbi:MAG: hypothetical protein KAQ62_26890 [Cyclobacteriaceae bacterium]|nr:hypothetical protein [Cyclobacteriaceae bacterium]